MGSEKGSLSITSENIFPVIKKWLYSDHDIFLRELVSNGSDAITKLKKLEGIGEWSAPEGNKYRVDVITDAEAKTITVTDNGIGMTADEVKKYINQIAFSGAKSFLEKYKDKSDSDQIIGHFGLGFYSAFMVADRVTIDTLSYQENAKPVHWVSEGGINYEMEDGDRIERGTKITLYLNDDSYEFSNEYKVKEVLEKYCSFMPVEIYYTSLDEQRRKAKEAEEKAKKDAEEAAKKAAEGKTDSAEADKKDEEPKEEKKEPLEKPVNEIHPLWTKAPSEIKDDEYKEFYRKVFRDYKEPLFWIHLNMDYPFNLKGILYFPKINSEYDAVEGTIKLYNNQVFVADNIKEVIPEYLLLLKGVIDCPDLPLNVSRSALQNDGFVKKISDYITKKVAEKLSGLCKTDRENYEKYWDDIAPFIKYGCLRDEKFADKMKDYILFKDLNDKYVTLDDYVKSIKPSDESVAEDAADKDAKAEDTSDAEKKDDKKEEKPKTTVYYVTDPVSQSQYINLFKTNGLNAVMLTSKIDTPFIGRLEMNHEDLKFMRIDSDVNSAVKGEEDAESLKKITEDLEALFKKELGKDKLHVKAESFKDAELSSMLTVSEESRRMQDMMREYNLGGDKNDDSLVDETLILNANNDLVKYLNEHKDEDSDNVKMLCEQLYDLAAIANRPLAADAMTAFIKRSNKIMKLLAK